MKAYLGLAIILVAFFFTRLYKIGQIPGSVYWDEASIGYNAWSVTFDGKDEWGEFLPLHFRAFGEFKLPVYIYSVAFLTKIFGLNELAVRLPAVLYTAGSVVVLFFLARKLTGSTVIALLSSFFFTASPWMFIFSRTGYEATAGLFFFLLFIYFLVNYAQNRLFIVPVALAGLLSFYSYNSFRILVPLALGVFGFYLLLIKKIKLSKKIYLEVIALLIFVVGLVPAVRLFLYDQGAVRLVTVGVREPVQIISNYVSHFSPDFLFVGGDANNRSQVPGWGQLFVFELPLILVGVWSTLKNKTKGGWWFLALLIIAPIPAALAKEAPHALRAILMAPAFAFAAATGSWQLAQLVKKYKKALPVGLLVVCAFSFGAYFIDFVDNYNRQTGSDWQAEYKHLFSSYTSDRIPPKTIITDQYAQPYIFGLYYLKISPAEFRKTVLYNPPDKWGFSTVKSFGGFEFE